MRTMTAHHAPTAAPDAPSTGGRLVAPDGRDLPLLSAHVRAEARGGIARTVLVQTFRNPYAEPLQVTYLLPLPHHGAVSAFSFRLGGRRVIGEVDRLQRARERFEEAVLEGKAAALLEQERGSLFTQQLGNVPPGAIIEAELAVDQRLDWRPAEGGWEWRFPTVVGPRYQGAQGRVPDAARTEVPVAEGPASPTLALALTVHGATGRPESPTHAVALQEDAGAWRVALAEGRGVALDRDLVVRWRASAPAVGLTLAAHLAEGGPLSGRAFGLVTVVPPAAEARPRPVPRDLVVLVDASGSMHGEPLDQARRVVGALVDSLGEEDTLELISFASAPARWRRGPVPATAAHRAEAQRWLARLRASGGTEMREGIRQALRGLRAEAQRQVVLVTDGLIGFEQEVVAELRAALPEGSRVHTVGVGSAVNRSLTGPAARAGRGLEVIVGLGEDPERAAAALRARTAAPLVTGLRLSGTALRASAPERLPDLFAGAPALVGVELDPAGGTLVVHGHTAGGPFERALSVPPAAPGDAAVAALFGRERVEDLETARAAGEDVGALDAEVEALGLAFQLSTRLTAWVAVSAEAAVDPSRPTRREEVPQRLPYGMSAEGLGLRGAVATDVMGGVDAMLLPPGAPPPAMLRRSRAMSVLAAPEPRAKRSGAPRREEAERGYADLERGEVQHVRQLAARVKVVKDRLVVEAEVEGEALDWKLPAEASLLVKHRGVPARVDPAGTTGDATLAPGQVLRLVLAWSGDPGDLEEILVKLGDLPLLLVVRH